MAIRDLKAQISRLPEQPGVYLYGNRAGDTIYIGRARVLRDRVRSQFPGAEVCFDPVPSRANIVDSWPGDVDDSPARQDWGWQPLHDLDAAFDDYLFPTLKRFYA